MTLGSRLSGRRTTSLTAAVLLTAAAGLVGALGVSAPARAADCASSGVTVIADFNQLGGGVVTSCDEEGAGKAASDLFPDAKLPLSYATRQPGFVCRVSGKPASDPCVNTSPASAYWGLWWSTGDPGSAWTYSTLGAGSLKVPAGGLVALSWDEVDGDAKPSASASRPAAPTPNPTPTPAPTPAPTTGGSRGGQGGNDGNGGNQSGSGGTSATPTPAPQAPESTDDPTADESATPSEAAGDDAQETKRGKKQRGPIEDGDAEPTADATPEVDDVPEVSTTDPAPVAAETEATGAEGDGLPGFVAPALIVLLFGGAGVAWWVRRRSPLDS
ncbi:hypothetical protein [Nocardioides sp.]|uniref:hypothetical protein n=1 Tax=Nocardioides sp. TaxID=35761 RepID=UPI002605EBB3|nr:hypothetical protein [Nocardioides sp.]